MAKMTDEEIVADYLKGFGFSVSCAKTSNSNGFDVVAVNDQKSLVVEVKRAKKVSGKNTYRTRSLTERAKRSDVVAVIMPTGFIHFEETKDFLKCCNSNGDRFFPLISTIR